LFVWKRSLSFCGCTLRKSDHFTIYLTQTNRLLKEFLWINILRNVWNSQFCQIHSFLEIFIFSVFKKVIIIEVMFCSISEHSGSLNVLHLLFFFQVANKLASNTFQKLKTIALVSQSNERNFKRLNLNEIKCLYFTSNNIIFLYDLKPSKSFRLFLWQNNVYRTDQWSVWPKILSLMKKKKKIRSALVLHHHLFLQH